jgi:hypothetical protein
MQRAMKCRTISQCEYLGKWVINGENNGRKNGGGYHSLDANIRMVTPSPEYECL